jgi:predicted transcriptional regulator
MNHATSPFNDPAEFNSASIGPELPHDCVEDLFLDAKLRVKMPTDLIPFTAMVNWWAMRVFAEFWKDYEAQENISTGDRRADATSTVIGVLQTVMGMKTRKVAMRAECLLALINKKEESQTEIAKKYDVTRAAVSKVIVQLKDDLGMPTARHMKSDTARESYRERALRVHAERKSKLCKTPTNSLFNKFWTSMSSNLKPPMPAPSN